MTYSLAAMYPLRLYEFHHHLAAIENKDASFFFFFSCNKARLGPYFLYLLDSDGIKAIVGSGNLLALPLLYYLRK